MAALRELILENVFSSEAAEDKAANWTTTHDSAESFEIALECSNAFLRDNWTGPSDLTSATDANDEQALQILGDADPAYRLCRKPTNLLVALKILEHLTRSSSDFRYFVELLKVYWMQQNLLNESSPRLYENMQKIVKKIDEDAVIATVDVINQVEYYLLVCHIAAYYQDFTKAAAMVQKAQQLSDISSNITGVLGKRTRFQEIEYAQLVVDVNSDSQEKRQSEDTGLWRNLPQNVPLDDDTLLPKPALSETVPSRRLRNHEAAVLLSEGILLQRRQAKQNLQDEEIAAYTEFILQCQPCYSIQASALFQRCKVEVDKSRKSLRAMQQLETLLTAFSSSEGAAFAEREIFALAANFPPYWKVQQELGYALLLNGCTKEAVNIFTSMELWEDVIECYQRMGQKVKAEDLILKELTRQPTPSMWCRLGDLREDVECYDTAWELSKKRSFRSRKDLGRLYLKRKQFTDAVRVFREGTEVNAVDSATWFLLGYALVKLKEYGSAETAFRRCVNLDPENSLAWNNLGSVALHVGDYRKAYKILQESVKTDFENWNIWDNYQNACQRVKDFDEEIKAFYRVLELKGNVNSEALALLVAAVVDGVTDIQGASAVRLLPKLKTLFGAITAKIPDNARIWHIYGKLQTAELTSKIGTEQKETLESIVQKFQKAYRHAVREKDWEKEEHSLTNCLVIVKDLADMQLELLKVDMSEEERSSIRSSLKVTLDNTVTKIQRSRGNSISGDVQLPETASKLFLSIADIVRILKS